MKKVLIILLIFPSLVFAQGFFFQLRPTTPEQKPELVRPKDPKLPPTDLLDRPEKENLKEWLARINDYLKVIDALRKKIKTVLGWRGDFDVLGQLLLYLSSTPVFEVRQEGGLKISYRIDSYDLKEQLNDLINNKGDLKELELLIEEQLIPHIKNTLEGIEKKLKSTKRGRVTFGIPDTDPLPIGQLYNEVAEWEPGEDPGDLLQLLRSVLLKLESDLKKLKETKGEQPPDSEKQGKPPYEPPKEQRKGRIITVEEQRYGKQVFVRIPEGTKSGDILKIIRIRNGQVQVVEYREILENGGQRPLSQKEIEALPQPRNKRKRPKEPGTAFQDPQDPKVELIEGGEPELKPIDGPRVRPDDQPKPSQKQKQSGDVVQTWVPVSPNVEVIIQRDEERGEEILAELARLKEEEKVNRVLVVVWDENCPERRKPLNLLQLFQIPRPPSSLSYYVCPIYELDEEGNLTPLEKTTKINSRAIVSLPILSVPKAVRTREERKWRIRIFLDEKTGVAIADWLETQADTIWPVNKSGQWQIIWDSRYPDFRKYLEEREKRTQILKDIHNQ